MDIYTILHFVVGILAYIIGIDLKTWILLNILFELSENTEAGMYIINNYIKIWPGGKDYSDSGINSIGDIIASIAGWCLLTQN